MPRHIKHEPLYSTRLTTPIMLIRGVTERSYLHLSPTHHIRMNLQGNTEKNLVMATFELPSLGKEKVSIGVYNWGLALSGVCVRVFREGGTLVYHSGEGF